MQVFFEEGDFRSKLKRFSDPGDPGDHGDHGDHGD
jgi:hypothetical protein